MYSVNIVDIYNKYIYKAEMCVAVTTQSIMDARMDAVPNQRSKFFVKVII